jgi:hypothetical protein
MPLIQIRSCKNLLLGDLQVSDLSTEGVHLLLMIGGCGCEEETLPDLLNQVLELDVELLQLPGLLLLLDLA